MDENCAPSWFTEEPGRFGAFGNGCGKARPE
jgi:hypothetical protein